MSLTYAIFEDVHTADIQTLVFSIILCGTWKTFILMDRKQLDPYYNIAIYSAVVIILNSGEEIEVKSLSRQKLFMAFDVCFLLCRYGVWVWHSWTHLTASTQNVSLQTGVAIKRAWNSPILWIWHVKFEIKQIFVKPSICCMHFKISKTFWSLMS